MNSMTGYGRGNASAEGMNVVVELASVNRKSLEISASAGREWPTLERVVTEVLRQGLRRGKVHATVRVASTAAAGIPEWEEQPIAAMLQRLRELAQKNHVLYNPDIHLILRLATLLPESASSADPAPLEALVRDATISALADLNAMRAEEGARLQEDCVARIKAVQSTLNTIQEHAVDTVPRYRELLLQRLRNANLTLDPEDERVCKEIALFADRCDISEEITRLGSHLQQFSETLSPEADAEPLGRKCEFLLQEIQREFNTIGAKANHLEISRAVIEAKNEIERIREQIQNIE